MPTRWSHRLVVALSVLVTAAPPLVQGVRVVMNTRTGWTLAIAFSLYPLFVMLSWVTERGWHRLAEVLIGAAQGLLLALWAFRTLQSASRHEVDMPPVTRWLNALFDGAYDVTFQVTATAGSVFFVYMVGMGVASTLCEREKRATSPASR